MNIKSTYLIISSCLDNCYYNIAIYNVGEGVMFSSFS